jgi:hypothetical protein
LPSGKFIVSADIPGEEELVFPQEFETVEEANQHIEEVLVGFARSQMS